MTLGLGATPVSCAVEPADAARALSEIGRRREQVIRRAATPRWYWWATAVLAIVRSPQFRSIRGSEFAGNE